MFLQIICLALFHVGSCVRVHAAAPQRSHWSGKERVPIFQDRNFDRFLKGTWQSSWGHTIVKVDYMDDSNPEFLYAQFEHPETRKIVHEPAWVKFRIGDPEKYSAELQSGQENWRLNEWCLTGVDDNDTLEWSKINDQGDIELITWEKMDEESNSDDDEESNFYDGEYDCEPPKKKHLEEEDEEMEAAEHLSIEDQWALPPNSVATLRAPEKVFRTIPQCLFHKIMHYAIPNNSKVRITGHSKDGFVLCSLHITGPSKDGSVLRPVEQSFRVPPEYLQGNNENEEAFTARCGDRNPNPLANEFIEQQTNNLLPRISNLMRTVEDKDMKDTFCAQMKPTIAILQENPDLAKGYDQILCQWFYESRARIHRRSQIRLDQKHQEWEVVSAKIAEILQRNGIHKRQELVECFTEHLQPLASRDTRAGPVIQQAAEEKVNELLHREAIVQILENLSQNALSQHDARCQLEREVSIMMLAAQSNDAKSRPKNIESLTHEEIRAATIGYRMMINSDGSATMINSDGSIGYRPPERTDPMPSDEFQQHVQQVVEHLLQIGASVARETFQKEYLPEPEQQPAKDLPLKRQRSADALSDVTNSLPNSPRAPAGECQKSPVVSPRKFQVGEVPAEVSQSELPWGFQFEEVPAELPQSELPWGV